MANRKKATEWFIEMVRKLNPDSDNVKMYEDLFGSMSDREFDALMTRIEKGETILPYFTSNLSKTVMRIDDILKVGDELGIDFFQRIWIVDPKTKVKYLTPKKYLIVDLAVRRQQQHLVKGKSLAENSKYTDPLTGQATGPSRTSRLSLPEIMILESSGHHTSIEEMIKVRGGDNVAHRESRRLTVEQGGYDLDTIEELDSRPTSTETLKAFLFGMHIDNNL